MVNIRLHLRLPLYSSSLTARRCIVQPSLTLTRACQRRWVHQKTQEEPIEEQTLSFYRRKNYYPVRIGQIFNDRYQVIAKLGYGGYSTVWLARDNRCFYLPP